MMLAPTKTPPVLSVISLLRPHWKAMTMAMVGVAGAAVTELLEPWPLKIVLDHLLQARPLDGWMGAVVGRFGADRLAVLNVAVLAVAVIAVAAAASSYLQNYLTTNVGQWVMHDLRRVLYHHIHRLSLAEHDATRTGDLISRVTSDINTIQDFVSWVLLGMLTNALTLVGLVGVMLYLNWRFTLISLSIAPLLFLVVYFFTRRIKKASRDVRKKESELLSIVQEVFSSIRVVKAFAREDYEERRFAVQSLDNVETTLAARNIKMMLAPVVEIIVATGTCLMLWYGARLVIADQLTAGALVVFLMYLGKMYKPMRDLSKMTDTVSKAGVSLERIREVLQTESGVRDAPRARRAGRFKGRIAFDKVSFAYDPEQAILKDVTFDIEPGQIAAFVGPTGGGKSTIINLVARFYDPSTGTVAIDGTDIRKYTMKSLRDQISFVLQETLLFHAPIWQNIAYGRPEATRTDIIRAAELANADEFITQMPEGYDTMVGERGVTLSGGQRQRIAIARAIIRDTRILVMDEPTSGLDAQSEQMVFEALGRLMKDKTSIVIAHHLATIRQADVIFVVNDHTLVERGTHDELLASGGFYSELHNIQFREDEPVTAALC
ncbi:MAG: ABC transporter ATP-binding protein [Vicinamibacterales bacterium]